MRQSHHQRHTLEIYGAYEAIDDLLNQIDAEVKAQVPNDIAAARMRDMVCLVRRNFRTLAAYDLPTRGNG